MAVGRSQHNNPFSHLSVTSNADISDWIDVADPSVIECKKHLQGLNGLLYLVVWP